MTFTWRQTSSTTLENKRSTFEQLYFLTQGEFGKPAPWILFTTVKFKNYDHLAQDRVETSLRNAWSQTRAKEPQIAARHGEAGKVVEVFEGKALQDWLSESFNVLHDRSPDDAYRESVSRRYPTLFYFPTTGELTLQANHSFIDGRGACFFWNNFFSALANPDDSPITAEMVKKRLPPTMDAILGVPETSSGKAEEYANRILERGMTDNPIYMPVDDPDAPPRGFLRQRINLNPEVSSKIFAACKQRGITVTAAVHVASALAIQEYQLIKQGKAGDTWAGFTNIDARRYFGGEYSHELQRVACHFTIMPLQIPISDNTFDKTTVELSNYYRKALHHPLAEGAIECLPAAMPLYLQKTAEGASFTRTPWLTTLGIIENFMERKYGTWEIEDFWLANTMVPPSVQLLLWTWRDQIVFGGAWNEAFCDAAVMQKLLVRSKEILLRALDIQD